MQEITKAEIAIVLSLVKSPEIIYNANNLAKVVNITSMGVLKILKRLENETILKSKKIGKATVYRINTKTPYARDYVSLILSREKLYTQSRVKRWIEELNKIKNAEIVVLFGSILQKENYNDVDVLLITNKKMFSKLEKEIEDLNKINIKRIHPLYQSFEDIIKNIKDGDRPVLNAIKGIFVKGENKFLEVYNESSKE